MSSSLFALIATSKSRIGFNIENELKMNRKFNGGGRVAPKVLILLFKPNRGLNNRKSTFSATLPTPIASALFFYCTVPLARAMAEEDPLLTPISTPHKYGLLNVVVMGVSFLLLFSGFNTASAYLTTALDPKIAFYSLSILYATFAVSNFVSAAFVKMVGPRYNTYEPWKITYSL